MIPPTPTLVPAGTPIPLDFQMGLWDLSPNVVGLWGTFKDYTPILQTIFVVLLLLLLLWTIVHLLKNVSEEEV